MKCKTVEGAWTTVRDKGCMCQKPRQRRKKDSGKLHRAIRTLGELLDLKPRREQFPVRLRKTSAEKPEKHGGNPALARPAATHCHGYPDITASFSAAPCAGLGAQLLLDFPVPGTLLFSR